MGDRASQLGKRDRKRHLTTRSVRQSQLGFLRRVPQHWQAAPRRWGHRLHSLCSYMAMFPPAIPHVFIQWLTNHGDVVYDPFSGRGTTALEACLSGRIGIGSDANPLAWLLTAAKCDPPAAWGVERRLNELESRSRPMAAHTDAAPEIRMLFTPRVLAQLFWLQSELDGSRRVDRYLLAVLAGMLHGNANRNGQPRGLSIPMPNTFAMAPRYVRQYIRDHKLKPPDLDVLTALRRRVSTFPLPGQEFRRGSAWLQDVSRRVRYPQYPPAKLIFGSPPYLEVIKYAKFNWVRHWLIQSDPRQVDRQLFTSSSLEKYLSFVTGVVNNLRPILRDDGYLCFVVGDVRRDTTEINLARAIADRCFAGSDLRVLGTIRDSLPVQHKVSRIWGARRGRATRTDRIVLVGGPKAKHLSAPLRIDWSSNSEG